MDQQKTIFNLIQNKVDFWILGEKRNSQSVIGTLIKYIEKENKLREPQIDAIKNYLWLKFVGKNQKLFDIIKQGLLYNKSNAKEYKYFNIFERAKNKFVTQFLNQFFQDNKIENIQQDLLNTFDDEKKWDKFLIELLHNYDYPNYLYSLPMGTGKTYLMACFIYLDLYFALLYKNDKRFAHNFIVLAPQASKTAILPSLKTIKNFNPEWILPKKEADELKSVIQIEILDALGSKRKDKLHGNNPNLEKVNRITATKDFGVVFITNAEKVVLEQYDSKDKLLVKKLKVGQGNLLNKKQLSEFEKSNELREKLSQIQSLNVILDEAQRSYENQNKQKKIRDAMNIFNQHKNIISVLGFSGTPYIKHKVEINNETIKLNQIQDVVYNYSLANGIGNFLKIPDVERVDVKEKLFIKKALDKFFNNYDKEYSNKTKSKIAFYCPSKKVLNEDILPAVQEWYAKNRRNKENEIFKFYTNESKDPAEYKIPKENLSIFHNLDKPYSDKRVILLVAIGKEGWDCKSLTAVCLPRRMKVKTSQVFVLQTTCRCLREVDNAKEERALIYLSNLNYEILDKELKKNYNLQISDLKMDDRNLIAVNVRKPKLGKIKYQQITRKWTIISQKETDKKANLENFNFRKIKSKYTYQENIINAKIGKAGLVRQTEISYGKKDKDEKLLLENFLYQLSYASFYKFSESDLLNNYETELNRILKLINKEKKWIDNNPHIEMFDVIKYVASLLMEEINYKTEIIKEGIEMELLEWKTKDPKMSLYQSSGAICKFMPEMTKRNSDGQRGYQNHPEYLIEDFFSDEPSGNNVDLQDISYNYIPYKADSNFERNALKEILKLGEMENLEVYYNGYKNENLSSFYIQTPRGIYTPDFLIIKRRDNQKYKKNAKNVEIEKILIIETKGKIYYDNDFKQKENFVKNEFIKYNPNFRYKCFVDDGKNDFSEKVGEF
ncbi:MAG: DEAD/DEAH box helicase family protein, partial [Patescibacteria group bacterium]|nr:DEAD/DEAH box helicase family protein [Patescibacteria group bacterium]